MSEWVTKITDDREPDPVVRGYKLSELIEKRSASEAQFLVLAGRLPTDKERQLFEAILVACLDHGVAVASAQAARYTASTGNALNAALSAGILALGPRHGGAATPAAELFEKLVKEGIKVSDYVAQLRVQKIRVPGFGHKVLKAGDPRVEALFKKAKALGFNGPYIKVAQALEKALTLTLAKPLPLNIDGALGALTLELGLQPALANAFFILSRTPGLLAHVLEEQAEGPGVRRLKL